MAIDDPRWKLHKSASRRLRELQNPQPLAETLTEEAAQQLFSAAIGAIRGVDLSGYFMPFRFVAWLAKQYGRHGELDVGPERRRPFANYEDDDAVEAIRAHVVGWVRLDRDRVVDFIDYYAQFLVAEQKLSHELLSQPQSGGYGDVGAKAAKAVSGGVAAVNAALAHNNVAFRIEADDEFTLAVHRISSEALEAHALEPALMLLRDRSMTEPLRAIESALREQARNEHADAIRDASHAVEAALKWILPKLTGTQTAEMDARQLAQEAVNCGLLSAPYQKDIVTAAVTLRNKEPGVGHGQAPATTPPESEIAEYAVNIAASSILFLIRRWDALKR